MLPSLITSPQQVFSLDESEKMKFYNLDENYRNPKPKPYYLTMTTDIGICRQ